MDIREWSSNSDTAAMQRLAGDCWPRGLHPGGLGWSQATGQVGDKIAVVDGIGGEVEGWAAVGQPDSLMLQVAPDRPDVAQALFEWLLHTADGSTLSVTVFDDQSQEMFTQIGFAPATPPFGFYGMGEPGLSAAVDRVSGAVPAGYDVRSLRPDEADARVAVHRAAWRPADLPFDPDHDPHLDPSWSSSFTLDAYRRVQETYLYDSRFDLVVEASDGSLAGCCIGWFDADTGWTEIEPLGVVPAHRRLGLAAALCTEVATRTAAAGGHHVFINTGPSNSYPGPYRAYQKAGFTPFVPGQTLTRG